MGKKINIPSKYDPKFVENGQYQKWIDEGVFKPSSNLNAKPYSIVIPPPNVTGKLHLGHAWDTTLQDIIIRKKRMQGYDVLWLPGTDHAGIATQAKVEAQLNEKGISRYDLGRKKFVSEVWKWVNKYSDIIHKQWAKLGISVDYSREKFTLDDQLSLAVKKVFVDLYNEGLIYREKYIINWDPKARTALSDIEVIHKDDKGAFYYIKYFFEDKNYLFNGKNYIEVATTRPETIFGDSAVAINPHDNRFKCLLGKKVIIPLSDKHIPIIQDEYVDPNFGTGIVKITPAHDPNDFKVGLRHNLEQINIMNEDATLNENAGKYCGLDRFVARKAIVMDLKKLGYIINIKPIIHSVGHSERTDVQVEYRLSMQWFVKMEPLAKLALDNQSNGNPINFIPQRFENIWKQWMNNVHDWVISRQLWWGHRIPAWYNKKTNDIYVGINPPEDIDNWDQDPDVLDTWFSSALWPFATMGWPDKNSQDYKRYFPTNTLVTGYDIIPFWVSRMIFQSLKFTGKIPFKNVLIHGLIRDEKGRKMSKSLGNGIDPMNVIDKYGSDSLRWFLTTGITPGQDIRFSYTKMDAAWNFINKIWNASRFVIMNLNISDIPDKVLQINKLDLSDRWILSKMNDVILKVTNYLDKFEFGEANRALYNFIWNDFCDWYIELSKETLNSDNKSKRNSKEYMLIYVLDKILKLMHPITPFVTEAIWQNIPHRGKSIVVAPYPKFDENLRDNESVYKMENIILLIRLIRNIRSEVNSPLSIPINVYIKTFNKSIENIFKNNLNYIKRFVNYSDIKIGSNIIKPEISKTAISSDFEVYVPLDNLIDLDKEISSFDKKLSKLKINISKSEKKLNNNDFIKKAPKNIIQKEKEKISKYKSEYKKILRYINELYKLKALKNK